MSVLPSMAPAGCLPLLLPGIYCFHFPCRWKQSLITVIFMCANNICSAASQDSGAREARTSALLEWLERRLMKVIPSETRAGEMCAGPREQQGLLLVPSTPFLGGTCFSGSSRLLPRVVAGENNPRAIPAQQGRAQLSAGQLRLQAPSLGKSPWRTSSSLPEQATLAQCHERHRVGEKALGNCCPSSGAVLCTPEFMCVGTDTHGARKPDRAHVSLSSTPQFL